MGEKKLIVLKYGGSSVSNEKKIKKIAKQIKSYYSKGFKILVVISAMGKFTDELLALSYKISKTPLSRELDVILTTGERISMALLSIALNDINIPAISFTGSQAGIITDCSHTKAKIINIKPYRVIEELNKNKVVIVAGFQGVSTNKNITTLGRGGSDLTAIALSIYLQAYKCIINTDVNGIYPVDPTIIKNIHPFKTLSLSEAALLSALGAKVMHDRACTLASRYKCSYFVRSTFSKSGGTMIDDYDNKNSIIFKNTHIFNNNNKNNNANYNKSTITITENIFIKAITGKENLIEIKISKNRNLKSILSIFNKYNINIEYFYSSDKNYFIYLKSDEYKKNIKYLKENKINKTKINLFVVHIIGEGINFFPGFIFKVEQILDNNNIYPHQMYFQGHSGSIFLNSEKYHLHDTIRILYNYLKKFFIVN